MTVDKVCTVKIISTEVVFGKGKDSSGNPIKRKAEVARFTGLFRDEDMKFYIGNNADQLTEIGEFKAEMLVKDVFRSRGWNFRNYRSIRKFMTQNVELLKI